MTTQAAWGATAPQYPTTSQPWQDPRGNPVSVIGGPTVWNKPAEWDFNQEWGGTIPTLGQSAGSGYGGTASAPGPSGWTAGQGTGAPAYTAQPGQAQFGGATPGQTYGATGAQPSAPLGGTAYAGGGSGGFDFRTGYGGGVPVANDPNGGGSLGSNPYLGDQVNYLKEALGKFRDQGLNQTRSNYVGAGYGGDAHKLAEGEVLSNSNRDFGGQVANLLGQNYQFDRGLNTNSYNTNRGLDIQAATAGAGITDLQNRGQLNALTTLYGLGSQAQNDQWSPLRNAASLYSPFSGLNSSTNTGTQGGGWQGALAGLLAGGSLGKQFGWF